ncbi:MAG: hypothetical protein ACD_26C00031G0007 [uncultured bacterium]|nr:MAG: hypothetical protein ACD_26C00031G0007 [uncultured bacterium]
MVLDYPFNPFYIMSLMPSFLWLWLFCYLYYKSGSKPNWKFFNKISSSIPNDFMNIKSGAILFLLSLFAYFLPH